VLWLNKHEVSTQALQIGRNRLTDVE